VKLTTLGTGTISLTPGRGCAAHLVEAGGVRLLLDCGSGTAHRMAALGVDWWGVTHVALTHFHADHVGDLPTLLFAYKHARRPGREAPLTLVGPAGTSALLDRMAAAFGDWVRVPGFPLHVRELPPGEGEELGDGVRLEARKVPHTEESVAYSIVRGGARVTYTGDTGFDAGLGEWAAGSDVLLCECSLPEAYAVPSHLTPEQCAEVASLAAPGVLALTHLYPPVEELDLPAVIGARFGGPVVVAFDGWSIELEER
jgi:ribonuclease BN (tRNA processing enzyme)